MLKNKRVSSIYKVDIHKLKKTKKSAEKVLAFFLHL